MLKGLLEKRAAKVAEMRSITESAKSREEQRMTAEEAERFDACEKEVAELDKEIHRAEVMEKEDMRKAQQRSTAATTSDANAEELRTFVEYLRTGKIPEEKRTAMTPDNNGVIMPKQISDQVILGLQGQFDMMKAVDLRITNDTKTFIEPILAGELELKRIVGEGSDDEGEVSFDGIEVKAYDYALDVIPISRTLIEGTDIDVANNLVKLFTEHISRGLIKLMTTSGVASDGISAMVPQLPVVQTAESNSITYNDLVDLLAKVKAPHNAKGNSAFAMNSSTLAAMMKLRDDDGKLIFTASVTEGEPDRMLGRPIIVDDTLPDIASGKIPIVFGNFKGYILRIAHGVKVYTYYEHKFQKKNCIGLQAFVTADGKLKTKTGAIEPLAGLKIKTA